MVDEIIISGSTYRSVFISPQLHADQIARDQTALADRLASSDLTALKIGPQWVWETTDSVMWMPGLLRLEQIDLSKILHQLEVLLIDPLANVWSGWTRVVDLIKTSPELAYPALRVLRRHPLFRTPGYVNPLCVSLVVKDLNANSKHWLAPRDEESAETFLELLSSFTNFALPATFLALEMSTCLKPRGKLSIEILQKTASIILDESSDYELVRCVLDFASCVIRETSSGEQMTSLLGDISWLFKKKLDLDYPLISPMAALIGARYIGIGAAVWSSTTPLGVPWLMSGLTFLENPKHSVYDKISVCRLITASAANSPETGQLYAEHNGLGIAIQLITDLLDSKTPAEWCLVRSLLHMVAELSDGTEQLFPLIARLLKCKSPSTVTVTVSVLTRLIQHDPGCIPQVIAADLVSMLPQSRESAESVAQCLAAVCVHSEGEKEVLRVGNPICTQVLPLFATPTSCEGAEGIGAACEELIRNKPDPWRIKIVNSLNLIFQNLAQGSGGSDKIAIVQVLQSACKLVEVICQKNSTETISQILKTEIPKNIFKITRFFCPPNFAHVVPSHSVCKLFKVFCHHSFQTHAKELARGIESEAVAHDWPLHAANAVVETVDRIQTGQLFISVMSIETLLAQLAPIQFALQVVAMAMKDVPPTTNGRVVHHLSTILTALQVEIDIGRFPNFVVPLAGSNRASISLFELVALCACSGDPIDKADEEKELRRRIREDRPWPEALFNCKQTRTELVRGLWLVVRGFMCQAARVINYPTVPKQQARRLQTVAVSVAARGASQILSKLAISMLRLALAGGTLLSESVDLLCRLHVEDKHHMTRSLCVDTFYKLGGVNDVLAIVDLCTTTDMGHADMDETRGTPLQSILWWFERTTSLKRMHNAQITHLLQGGDFDAIALVSSLQAEFARGFATHWRNDECIQKIISAKASASLLKAFTHVLEPNELVLRSQEPEVASTGGLIASLIRRATASLSLGEDRPSIWAHENAGESSNIMSSLFRSLDRVPYVPFPVVLERAKDIAKDFMERTLVLGASPQTAAAAAQTHIADVCVRLSHNKILQLGSASEEVVQSILAHVVDNEDEHVGRRARAGTVVVVEDPGDDTQARIDAVMMTSEESQSVETIEETVMEPVQVLTDYSVFNTRHIAETCLESNSKIGFTILACLLHARFSLCSDIVSVFPSKVLSEWNYDSALPDWTTSAFICIEKLLAITTIDYTRMFALCISGLGQGPAPDEAEALFRVALACQSNATEMREREQMALSGLNVVLKLEHFEGVQAMMKKLISRPPIESELFRLESEIVSKLKKVGTRGMTLSQLNRIMGTSVCAKYIKLSTVLDGLVAWRSRPDKRPRLDESDSPVLVTLLPDELRLRELRCEPKSGLTEFDEKIISVLLESLTSKSAFNILFLIESVCLAGSRLSQAQGDCMLVGVLPEAHFSLEKAVSEFEQDSKKITAVQQSLKLIETLFIIAKTYSGASVLKVVEEFVDAHDPSLAAVLIHRALAIAGSGDDWVKTWCATRLEEKAIGILECLELATRPPVTSTIPEDAPAVLEERILALQITAQQPVEEELLGEAPGDAEDSSRAIRPLLLTEGLELTPQLLSPMVSSGTARQLPQWYARSSPGRMIDDFMQTQTSSVLFSHVRPGVLWSFPGEIPADHPFISRSHTGATGSPVLAAMGSHDGDEQEMTEWLRQFAPRDSHLDEIQVEVGDEDMLDGDMESMVEFERRLAEMEQFAEAEEEEARRAEDMYLLHEQLGQHPDEDLEDDQDAGNRANERAEWTSELLRLTEVATEQTVPPPVEATGPAEPTAQTAEPMDQAPVEPSIAGPPALHRAASRFGISVLDFVNLTGIDPGVLGDLPEEMHGQIIAEYVSQLDPEVLSQLGGSSQNAAPEPDNATFLSTITQPEIRQEIFLTASEEFLASLPPDLHAEAIMARERMSRAARRGRLARPSLVDVPRHQPSANAMRSITELFNRALVDRPFGTTMVNVTAPAEEVADLMRMLGTRGAQGLQFGLVRQPTPSATLSAKTVKKLCNYYDEQIDKGKTMFLPEGLLETLLKLAPMAGNQICVENVFFNLSLHRLVRADILRLIIQSPIPLLPLLLFLVETIPAVSDWLEESDSIDLLIKLLLQDAAHDAILSLLDALIVKRRKTRVKPESVHLLLDFLFANDAPKLASPSQGTAILIALGSGSESPVIASRLLDRLNAVAGQLATELKFQDEQVSPLELRLVELVRIVKKLSPEKLKEKDSNRTALWNALDASLVPFDAIHHEGGHGIVVHHGVKRLFTLVEAFLMTHESVTLAASPSSSVLPTPSRSMSKGLEPVASPNESELIAFVERHRRPLNGLIRENFELLTTAEGPFSAIVKCCPWTLEFDNKRRYFRHQLGASSNSNVASTRLSVRRSEVFMDSYYQLRARSVAEMKGKLSVQFTGEEGVDAGGLVREWFGILAREIFNPNYALFRTAGGKASTFHPNPASFVNPDHLSFFHFCGRIMAKAILDDQRLDAYFTRSFYKHMLGSPVTWMDFEVEDPDYYKQLQWILNTDLNSDAAIGVVEHLSFTTEVEEFGHVRVVELVPGGVNLPVTEETKKEYVRLVCEYKMTKAITPQVESFLKGFHELVPAALIGELFDDKELELLISGLPTINLTDWKANTDYVNYTSSSSQIQWLWNVLEKDFSEEQLAWFLQFVTGSTQVPLEGFKALTGMRGPQRFSIHKAYGSDRLPTAHTCFNQLDLPDYKDEDTLRDKLLKAVSEAHEGFGFI